MLSRIAESLYWIGRYVERADDTARILDVHLQHLLEDPWAAEDVACRSLLAVMGSPDVPDTPLRRADVLDRLAYSTGVGSIVGALGAARENARRARETISTEMWECLNTTWNSMPQQARPGVDPHRFFGWVRERAAVVAGIADATMSRDLPWHFLTAGRSIERADMTARLVASRVVIGDTGPAWPVLLRSCGAHEAFLRAHHGIVGDSKAAEFLLLDRLFPRSVVFAMRQGEVSLEQLGGGGSADRGGASVAGGGDARRLLGRARADLEYRSVPELLEDLPRQMQRVQQACSAASVAISSRYFPSGVATAWVSKGIS